MKKLLIGIDFSKQKFDATIIPACGIKEIGSGEYGSFPNDTKGYRRFFNVGQDQLTGYKSRRMVILWRGHRFLQYRAK
jgi:transposase